MSEGVLLARDGRWTPNSSPSPPAPTSSTSRPWRPARRRRGAARAEGLQLVVVRGAGRRAFSAGGERKSADRRARGRPARSRPPRFRSYLAGRRARRHRHPDLHLRHHRPAEGRAAVPPQFVSTLSRDDAFGVFSPGGRTVSYLPLAHVADRASALLLRVATGSSITCIDDPKAVLAGLVDARPTAWLAVPRIWEKIKAGLEAKGVTDPAALPDETKAGIRAQLGLDQAEVLFSGAAPIAPTVLEFFIALGCPSSRAGRCPRPHAPARSTRPDEVRVGTIGKPMPGVETKLAEDGEFLVRGPSIMLGYRNDPEKTAEAIDADGWLHTGDIVDHRRRRLRDDRRPQEGADHQRRRQEHVAGQHRAERSRPRTPSSVRPAASATRGPTTSHCSCWTRTPRRVRRDQRLATPLRPRSPRTRTSRHSITSAVEEANSRLSRVEQIKKFRILDEDWLPDSEVLDADVKLKRRGVNERYADQIEELYA